MDDQYIPTKKIDVNFDDNLKHNKRKKKKICPFCGNEMKGRIIGEFMFCNRCHKKMPGKIMKTDNSPFKPL